MARCCNCGKNVKFSIGGECMRCEHCGALPLVPTNSSMAIFIVGLILIPAAVIYLLYVLKCSRYDMKFYGPLSAFLWLWTWDRFVARMRLAEKGGSIWTKQYPNWIYIAVGFSFMALIMFLLWYFFCREIYILIKK